jgi:hypothetical protein
MISAEDYIKQQIIMYPETREDIEDGDIEMICSFQAIVNYGYTCDFCPYKLLSDDCARLSFPLVK